MPPANTAPLTAVLAEATAATLGVTIFLILK
jgi:hypothetical protein